MPGRRSVLQRVDKRAERWEWSSKRVERLRRIECVIHELKAVTRLEALSRVPDSGNEAPCGWKVTDALHVVVVHVLVAL